MADELKVLGVWTSPFSMRVCLALEEKGVPYEYSEEDLSNKSQLLLKYNPIHKKIPVLIHSERSVLESNIIVQYIDETWPQKASLMPSDPYARAQARFWADFIDKKMYDEGIAMFYMAKGEAFEKGKGVLVESLAILEGLLVQNDNPYFNGQEFGFVDIVLVPFISWFKGLEVVGKFSLQMDEKFPKINAWCKRCITRDSVNKVLPDPEKVAEFLPTLRNKHAGSD